jgi:hypothetical protein
MFIAAIVQAGIKIGDLTHHASLAFASDAPGDEMMAIDEEDITIPEGVEPGGHRLSREEERALVRDSTAGFAGTMLLTGTNWLDIFRQIGWPRSSAGSFPCLRTSLKKEENAIPSQDRKNLCSNPSRACWT